MSSRFYQRYVPLAKDSAADTKANVKPNTLSTIPNNEKFENSSKIKKNPKKKTATNPVLEHRPGNQKSSDSKVQKPIVNRESIEEANVEPNLSSSKSTIVNDEESGSSQKIKKKSKKKTTTDRILEHRPEIQESLEPEVEQPTVNKEPVKEAAVSNHDHGLTPFAQPAQTVNEPNISISSALPGWIRDPTIASSAAGKPFSEFPLSSKVKSNLSKAGFSTANGLQSKILPMILPHSSQESYKGDLCISAATGSGKTLAYALPLVESLRDKPVKRLRGLVVVPTRELVSQAHKTLEIIAAGTGLKIGAAVGSNRLIEEQGNIVQRYERWSLDTSRQPSNKVTKRQKSETEGSEEPETGGSAEPETDGSEEPVESDSNEDWVHERETDEELMNWDLDFAEGEDDLEIQRDHVLDYASSIDILVCTPGRLVDHINQTKGFHLHHVQWLIIDEADRLLDESFQEWVTNVMPPLEYVEPQDPLTDEIFQSFRLPRKRRVRKIILSATMTKNLSQLNSLHLSHPRMVVLESANETQEDNSHQNESIKLPESLVEVAMAVTEANYKPLYVVQLLQEFAALESRQNGNAANKADDDVKMTETTDDLEGNVSDASTSSSGSAFSVVSQAVSEQEKNIAPTLIFARSNESALRLARLLSLLLPEQQIRALTKAPSDRKGRKTLSMFSKGKVSVVVATDLASRGLDIPQLGYVINYDMPASLVSYVHRVGRTARAGREGRAVTLVEHKEGNWFWNDIARARGLSRVKKVTRMDGGLRAAAGERRRYEDALHDLGREALGKERN